MRNTIYKFGKRYTQWRAVFPGDFVPALTFEGKCSYLRAKSAHLVGHLPEAEEGEHGVRLVAPDVRAAQARSARGGVGPEIDGVRERGIARLARNQGRPPLPGPGFSLLAGLALSGCT